MLLGSRSRDGNKIIVGKEVKPMEYDILCIFTQTGRTYTFRNVELTCDNETVLQFNYCAMSDGRCKTATFPKTTLCGWSVTPRKPQTVATRPG